MRRVYVLKENEEDGRVLDLLLSRGMDPDEAMNPECPLCGTETLLAYLEGGEYYVLTNDVLTDEDLAVKPDAWRLICQEFDCPYEEQVERVDAPEEAEVFDLEESFLSFDEYCGLASGQPSRMQELIAYFLQARKAHPHPKLEALLDEAQWRYDAGMKQVRTWIDRIPPGRRIEFFVQGEQIKARFITATEETILVQTWPDGAMLAVPVEALDYYGPRRFDEGESDPPDIDTAQDPDRLISIYGGGEFVVVNGYHLHLSMVDRFGQYYVSTAEREAGVALGLKEEAANYFTGRLRRSDIAARYTKRRMVRVKGYWIEVHGETGRSRSPWVGTEVAEIATALGLKLVRPIFPDEEIPEHVRQISRWSGMIPRDQVEEWDEIILYQWPIPEVKVPGAQDQAG